jgi:CYTH domain-containing protein
MTELHKYARVERERRFLLDYFPTGVNVLRTRRIRDRYIADTTLRLREVHEDHSVTIFKLTQKLAAPSSAAQQGLITTLYLTEREFHVLAQLSANEITKTRYSVPPFGIDVFAGDLKGL